ASPVPANSRSLLVSSERRNWGLFGLKKLRGCGSKVTAKAGLPWLRPICRAAAITARWPRWTPSKLPMATTAPLGIASAGVVSRMTVKPFVIAGILGSGSWHRFLAVVLGSGYRRRFLAGLFGRRVFLSVVFVRI